MTTASQSAFARQLGFAKSRITQLKQAGRIVMAADGKSVDVEASIARINATADPGRVDVAERHAAGRVAAGKAEPAVPSVKESLTDQNIDAGLGAETTGRAKAKALLMHYENSSLKLEMALRRGLRFERAAVQREAASLGAMLRAGIERVIDQTAPRLAAAGNDLQRRQIVEGELRRLKAMLKREMPRALRRMRSDLQKKSENAA